MPPQKYGVTCAHVMTSGTVEQPAQIDSKRAAAIGTVSAHTSLQLPVGLCTPKSATGVNTVDIALSRSILLHRQTWRCSTSAR